MPGRVSGYWYARFTWVDAAGIKHRVREPLRDELQRACLHPKDAAPGVKTTSPTKARVLEQTLREKLVRGELVLDERGRTCAPATVAPSALTLEGFRDRYFAEHVAKLKPSSRAAQKAIWDVALVPAAGPVLLASVGEVHFAGVAKLVRAAGRSPKTVNNALSALRTALTLAAEWGLRAPPPKVRWEKVPEPPIEWFEPAEIERLLAVADPAVTVALKTGLRLGELLALRWEDIKVGKITVARSVWWRDKEAHEGPTKSGRIRVVPLPKLAREALASLPGKHKGYVFTNDQGGQLTKGETKWPLWRACDAAGVERCGWHKLRHTYVSSLVRAGVPLPQVQKLAGHARIEMTMRYTHVSPADLERAAAALD